MEVKETFSSHIEAVAPGISVGLISPQGMDALRRLCGLLPFDTATSFGFESRLGGQEPACDFFLMLTAAGHGPAMLAGKSKVAGLSHAIFGDPFWERLTDLFAAWTGASSLLTEKLELLWLEFDYTGQGYETTPNIFFRIRQNHSGDADSQWNDMQQVLNAIYRTLFRIDFPDDLGGTLKQCFLALPSHAGLYQVGFMVPRKTEALRLVLTNLREDALFKYLHDIGWPGDVEPVENMIHRYGLKFDYTVANIYIGKSVLPFFGLELYLKEMKQPGWEPRWKEIFSLLVNDGLALGSKCSDVPGFCGKKTTGHLFPITYINGINHLKMVYKKDHPPECKAYFGTMIRK